MKGIILAGGTGSRLSPLTSVTNKHLLPVGHYPMLYHPIMKLKEAGVNDILIVTGKEHMGDIVTLLGSGYQWDLSFTYKVQDRAGGIAEALGLAKDFVGTDECIVVLGDNIFEDNLKFYVDNFDGRGLAGARIFLKEVKDPQRFGVAETDENGRVIGIVEKPKEPKSNMAVIGVYMYDHHVFEFVETLEPSERGELEITDVNNWYVKQGIMKSHTLDGYWSDAGTFKSLQEANKLVMKDKNIDWEMME